MPVSKKTTKKHGGNRAGAGRKRSSPLGERTAPLSISLTPTLVDVVDTLARVLQLSRSETIAHAVMSLAAANLEKMKSLDDLED